MLKHDEVDIFLIRRWFSRMSTIGELFYPDRSMPSGMFDNENILKTILDQSKRECFILEDEARPSDVKIKHHTSISAGDYFLKITHSPRFKRLMPLIYNESYYVDESGTKHYDLVRFNKIIFTGIRMHKGNTIDDTDACQLLGAKKVTDGVWDSAQVFDPFYDKLFKNIGTDKKLRYRIINLQEL